MPSRPQTEREWLEGDYDDAFFEAFDEDGYDTMVDLGGGMVVPLRELIDDDYEL